MRIMCCLLLVLSACSSHPVRCNGHLWPINVAAGQGTSAPGGANAMPSSNAP